MANIGVNTNGAPGPAQPAVPSGPIRCHVGLGQPDARTDEVDMLVPHVEIRVHTRVVSSVLVRAFVFLLGFGIITTFTFSVLCCHQFIHSRIDDRIPASLLHVFDLCFIAGLDADVHNATSFESEVPVSLESCQILGNISGHLLILFYALSFAPCVCVVIISLYNSFILGDVRKRQCHANQPVKDAVDDWCDYARPHTAEQAVALSQNMAAVNAVAKSCPHLNANIIDISAAYPHIVFTILFVLCSFLTVQVDGRASTFYATYVCTAIEICRFIYGCGSSVIGVITSIVIGVITLVGARRDVRGDFIVAPGPSSIPKKSLSVPSVGTGPVHPSSQDTSSHLRQNSKEGSQSRLKHFEHVVKGKTVVLPRPEAGSKRQRLGSKTYISYLTDDADEFDQKRRFGLLDKQEWQDARYEAKLDFMENVLPMLFDKLRGIDQLLSQTQSETLHDELLNVKASLVADISDFQGEHMTTQLEQAMERVITDPSNEPYLDELITHGIGGVLERGEAKGPSVLSHPTSAAIACPGDFQVDDFEAMLKIKQLHPEVAIPSLPSTFAEREKVYATLAALPIIRPEADTGQPQISDEKEASKIATIRDSVGTRQGHAFLFNFSQGPYFVTLAHVLRIAKTLDYKGKKYPSLRWEFLPGTEYARCSVPRDLDLKGVRAWKAYTDPLHYMDFAEVHLVDDDGNAAHCPGWLMADLGNKKYPQRYHCCKTVPGYSGAPVLTTTGFGDAQVIWVLGIHHGSIGQVGLMTPMTTILKIANASTWTSDIAKTSLDITLSVNWVPVDPATIPPTIDDMRVAVANVVQAEVKSALELAQMTMVTANDVKQASVESRKERASKVVNAKVKATAQPEPGPSGVSTARHNETKRLYNLVKMYALKVGPLTPQETSMIKITIDQILALEPKYDMNVFRKFDSLKDFIPAPSVNAPK